MTRYLRLIPVALLATFATAASAADTDTVPALVQSAGDSTLDDWRWRKRPVVVFADSPNDPRFVEQMRLIEDRLEALETRDVVVLTDTAPKDRGDIRRSLRPRGFMLAILAKDGTVVARKPAPWDVREISRSIDKLPLRQQEVREN
jgi:hypothetical protein